VHFADLVAAVVGLDVGEVNVAAVDLAARGRGHRGGARAASRGPAPPAAAPAAGRPGRSGRRRRRLLRRWSHGGRAGTATATATATAAASASAAGAGGGVLEVDLLAELEAVKLVVPAAATGAAAGLHCGGDETCQRTYGGARGGGVGFGLGLPLFSLLLQEGGKRGEGGGGEGEGQRGCLLP